MNKKIKQKNIRTAKKDFWKCRENLLELFFLLLADYNNC